MLLEPASPARILRSFAAFCSPIVFGAEKRVNPDSAMILHYPEAGENPPPFPYLNAGTFIGEAKALRTMYRSIFADLDLHFSLLGSQFPAGRCDDQRWITRYMFNPAPGAEVAIDSKGVIFHTLDGVQAGQINPTEGKKAKAGRLISTVPGVGTKYPAIIHGQGIHAKPLFEELVKQVKESGFLDRDDVL
jgi:hypothetical protein